MSVPISASFPIVGIGASAGGLEALEVFLRNVPPACGMAFVIVQHLDPTQPGMLAEILQRATPMKVAQITDGMLVEANRVYVIPPNADLTLAHGVLHLAEPSAPRGLRLPIDHFFTSLADDAGPRAIGVILSGMGSDGALGVQTIKVKGGAVFVQSPETASFNSMPTSVVESGVAIVAAGVEALPGEIVAYLRREPPRDTTEENSSDESAGAAIALDQVITLLRTRTSHDFSEYKRTTVRRRVERRVGIHRLASIAAYAAFVEGNPAELDLLLKELLISVTSFFRDADVWEQLRTELLPEMIRRQSADEPLRAWVVGCATGEEAYSLAMVFREALEAMSPPVQASLQIFATDLDRDAIDKARAGLFPHTIAAEVSVERRKRFFTESDRGYQINRAIRETIIFAPHNVGMDPPFTRIDLVTCRNLLIYLKPELQNKVLPLFHYCLNPGGALLLGNSESLGTATDLFVPAPGAPHLYARTDTVRRSNTLGFPSAFARARVGGVTPTAVKSGDSVQAEAERFLLARCTPAAVLVDEKGDIQFINGRTGKYLEPAGGKTNWNVFAMAREGLRFELSDVFRKALRSRETTVQRGIRLEAADDTSIVDLTIEPLDKPELLRGLFMIVFADAPPAPPAVPPLVRAPGTTAQVAELELELTQAQQALQATRDQSQSSQEELNTAIEELQSANEELQSTNEELTTSKEEMQSMNEELQSLNHELQAKIDDLSRVSNDMKNLLESTEIATVFLDAELRVRLYTAGSNRIFKLIPSDTGRPLTDLSSELTYPALAADAREVLRTLAVHEQPATTRDGRWFLVRIMPYRTLDNHVEGVAITFTDITASKQLEGQLRQTQAGLEKHIEAQAQQIEDQQTEHPA